ncbi:MAG: hypothetical protein Q9222_007221 [Ikaeria aurantiellina]
MYGEDSNGRIVSLLNHGGTSAGAIPSSLATAPAQPARRPFKSSPPRPTLPPLNPESARTRCNRARRSISPTAISPASTPPLVRHRSSSSQSESNNVSPMTPSYLSDPLDSHNKSTPYFARPRQNGILHPSLFQDALGPSHSLQEHDVTLSELGNGIGGLNQQALLNLPPPLTYSIQARPTIAPVPIEHPSLNIGSSITASISSPSPSKIKPSSQSAATQTQYDTSSPTATTATPAKKKFPCPHAAMSNCSDTFTTSGHAARHGKKHTGEKSVVCPVCNKAFSRKDNMKQHERTHKTAAERADPSDHKQTLRQRDGRSNSPSLPLTESASSATTDTSAFDFGSRPPASSNGRGTSHQSSSRRPRPSRQRLSSNGEEEEDGEGESPGLDALAVAASMDQ